MTWTFCTPGFLDFSFGLDFWPPPCVPTNWPSPDWSLSSPSLWTGREPAVVDLTEENPSQHHQDWTENGATTPPAPFRCPICLLDILPEASHQNMPYQWPSCQHPIHLGCLLHLMTRRSCPTCPTCREPWSPDTNPQLEQTRRAANVEWPVPEIPEDEDSPRDRPPNRPPDIIPLCCPRLVLIDPTQPELDSSWRELPSCHMDWAPNLDQTTREWQAEWVCLRCNNHVTGAHPSIPVWRHQAKLQHPWAKTTCHRLPVPRTWLDLQHWVSTPFSRMPTHTAPRADPPWTPYHRDAARHQWPMDTTRATSTAPEHASHTLVVLRSTSLSRGPQAPPRHRDAMGTATRRGRMDTPRQPTPRSTARALATTPYHHHYNPTPERQ